MTVSESDLRRRLYDVFDDDDLSLEEKQRRALSLGREYLGVENAHVQRRDDGTDTVVASVGENPEILPEGTVLDRATTYCRRTVEAHSPVALSNVPEQGWDDDPAYAEHGFDCYLGTTVFVDGEAYGTVCFVSRAARSAEFTSEEEAFVELLARLLGREIAATEYEAQIEQTERAQRRSQGKYEALLRLAPDAVFLADAETGRVREVNDRAVELTGYDESTLTELSVLDLHPPDERERYARLFEREEDTPRDRFDDGTPLHVRRADGTDVPVELSTSEVEIDGQRLVQGIVRDVSERHERERELRVKSRALEESTVGITIADATQSDNPIVYANDGFTRLTGYDADRVVGSNCRFLQGEATDEETVAAIRAAVDAEEPIQTEILNYRANGTPFWNRVTIAPVTAPDGERVESYVGVQEDVTVAKRREQLINVLDRVLRHNLRNEMNVVTGFADMIADRSDDEAARLADRIAETAADLTELAEKAHRVQTTVGDTGSPAVRDVVSDVEAVVADLRRECPGVEFRVDGADRGEVIATDRLRLALAELGENAAKHGGATITYRVETAEDGDVAVHVSDDGPGLPEMERRVLEKGYETPLAHGSGVGLWLVNWVVSGFGGDVSTAVDDGTTVTVRLPAGTEDAVPEHRNSALGAR